LPCRYTNTNSAHDDNSNNNNNNDIKGIRDMPQVQLPSIKIELMLNVCLKAVSVVASGTVLRMFGDFR
jgi:hypothetical protein